MPPKPPFRVKLRYSVSQKIIEIKEYIDNQRGNDPNDLTGYKVVKKIVDDLINVASWPWVGSRIDGMGTGYRKRKVGRSYTAYYYVDEIRGIILLTELRHTKQNPPSISSLRKYKKETENQ